MFTNSPSSLTFCPLQKTTCPDWTIYSWKGFYLIGCPLLLRTNYRCVESLNISVDVAKCLENVHKFNSVTLTFCPLQKTTSPDWTIYSWQGFNSLVCPLGLKTNYRCVQSLNISVDVTKFVENVHKFTQFTHFLSVTKNDLSYLNNLFMARFQLISMFLLCYKHTTDVFSHSTSVLTSPNVWKMFTNSPSSLTFYPLQKTTCRDRNNLFVAGIQLISMSSYAKNKLQICSVTQHQCRWRQMCGKCSQIQPSTLTFCPLQKNDLSWLNNLFMPNIQLTLGCPLMLRTNYRCVESLNISVYVAKCVEMLTH